jgi:hypothetical protein
VSQRKQQLIQRYSVEARSRKGGQASFAYKECQHFRIVAADPRIAAEVNVKKGRPDGRYRQAWLLPHAPAAHDSK